MRLIDADALKKDIARLHILNDEAEIRRAYASNPYSTLSDFEDTLVSVFDDIDEAPTIDAVSVVRCGECKLGGTEDCPMDEIDDEYFCNFGEREGE